MLAGKLRQSTTVTILFGPFVDSTDGNADEGGLTITQADVRLSKNGGNMAQKAETTSLVHDELGMYTCLLNTGDTDTLGILSVIVHESGALHVRQDYMVIPTNEYDSDVLGTDAKQVHVVEMASGVITATVMAANAIGASEFTQGAADKVWGTTTRVLSAGTNLNDLSAADVNAQVDVALNTAIPGGPTAESINQRILALDDLTQAAGAGDLAAILGDTNELQVDNTPGAIAGLNNISAADVNAQVLDVVATDTIAESSGVPAANASLFAKIAWLATLARNRITQTATTTTLRNDADNGDIATSLVSDDNTTFDKKEWT